MFNKTNNEIKAIYSPNERKCVIWGTGSMMLSLTYFPLEFIVRNESMILIISALLLCFSIGIFIYLWFILFRDKLPWRKKVSIGFVFSFVAIINIICPILVLLPSRRHQLLGYGIWGTLWILLILGAGRIVLELLKKIKILRILFLLAIVIAGMIQVSRYEGIKQADIIVRVAYRGLENMFHAKYEYYAINSKRAYRVSKRRVQEDFGKGYESRNSFDKGENTRSWLVELQYSGGKNYDFSDKGCFLKTSLGGQYRLYYSELLKSDTEWVDAKEQEIMLSVSEMLFHEKIPVNRQPSGDSSYSVFHFILIKNETKYLIYYETKPSLMRIGEAGNLTKVMDLPAGGMFDYYYFYDSQ